MFAEINILQKQFSNTVAPLVVKVLKKCPRRSLFLVKFSFTILTAGISAEQFFMEHLTVAVFKGTNTAFRGT